MRQVLKKVDGVLEIVEKIISFFVIVAIMFMSLAVVIGVFTRNMDLPITWLQELARYLQVWFVCLGAGLAFRKNNLPGIETFRDAMPLKIRKFLMLLAKVLMIFFLWELVAYGNVLIQHVIKTSQMTANLRIPMSWVYAGPLVGFSLMNLFIVVSILHDLFPEREEKEGK